MWNNQRGHFWNFVVRNGLIMRCDWKVGNPFQTKQGSQPSCGDQDRRRGSEEVVPENIGVPLEGDRYVGELCGLHAGCQVPLRPPILKVGLLLRRCSGKGPHVAMTGEPRGFPRVAAGFSNYDGEFRMPLVLAQEVQCSFRVVRDSWGLLSSDCRANSPHLGLCPEASVPLLGPHISRGCLPDSTRESGLVASGSKVLHSPLESQRLFLDPLSGL